jgi:hypothetical protein
VTGRNEPCTCGSGRQFKKCHGGPNPPPASTHPLTEAMRSERLRRAAQERIRREQQELGKPIVSFNANGEQFVFVGNKLHHSPTWKTFPDFLSDYLKGVLEPGWGNAELAKPFEQRHPLVQWYDAYCRYQQKSIPIRGVPTSAPVTGVVACYLGLAYSLYLLSHNVELQRRLIGRLQDPGNFQGAYYELLVANILIRAGFRLTLEDESDGETKHCEFAAVSSRTGKKYWVEAKMRSVAGYFGKTQIDGTSSTNPISRMIPHLNGALAKPAVDDQLIFIDLNAEPQLDAEGRPVWIARAAARLEQYEQRELSAGTTAYVFITNLAFHRMLDVPPSACGFPFGLGMPDFNRPGRKRVSDAYRQKRKHIDAHYIGEAVPGLLKFPSTFDGGLPSDSKRAPVPRVCIGETYCFGDPENGGVIGTVTTATVDETKKEMYVGVTTQDGHGQILHGTMTDAQLADYQNHKDSYFGRIVPAGRKVNDPFELFEWFVEQYKSLPREKLIASIGAQDRLNAMSDEDLLYEHCERMVAMSWKEPARSS